MAAAVVHPPLWTFERSCVLDRYVDVAATFGTKCDVRWLLSADRDSLHNRSDGVEHGYIALSYFGTVQIAVLTNRQSITTNEAVRL